MLIFAYLFSFVTAYKNSDISITLNHLLRVPYPELKAKNNVIALNSEIIIYSIEKTFTINESFIVTRKALDILKEISYSFNEPFPQVNELNILSNLMEKLFIKEAIANMERFVSHLPRIKQKPEVSHLAAAIFVQKQYVFTLTKAVQMLQDTDLQRRIQGLNQLITAFEIYHNKPASFYDLIKLKD